MLTTFVRHKLHTLKVLSQEDHKFEVNLGYVMKPYLKKKGGGEERKETT